MWFGKLSIILYIFSFAMVFGMYYMNLSIFHDPIITSSVSYQSINNLVGTFAFNQNINSGLIFGDFLSVYNLLGGLMTGSATIASPFAVIFGGGGGQTGQGLIYNSGFADASVGLFMAGLFDAATLFLLLYIVSNRSV